MTMPFVSGMSSRCVCVCVVCVTLVNYLMQRTHIAVWLNHTDRVSHIALSPDGTALGSSSWDGTVKVS